MSVKHLPGRHNQQDHADGAAGAVVRAADKLGLADRIQLQPGESLTSSARLATAPGSSSAAVMAVLRSERGRQVRLGIVAADDARRWRAGNRGGTVDLDESAVAKLDADLAAATTAGNTWQRQFRGTWGEIEALEERRDELDAGPERDQIDEQLAQARRRADVIDGDAAIAAGVVPGGEWGDIAYQVSGTDDGDGGWELTLAVRPPNAGADWDIYENAITNGAGATFTPAQIRTLRRQLAGGSAKTAEGSGMQVKSFRAEVKAGNEEGTLSFVVATLNEVDKDGDVTLPGFFGKQHTVMVPVHDWNHVPIGKGVVYEQGNEAIAEIKLNLAIPEAKTWHEALKFDMANPPALQEYSYGYTVLDGGSERGQHKGRNVRFLKGLPDGSPGGRVHEVSPVLLGAGNGTRTLGVKSAPIRFADEAQAVVAAVRALSDRAADVMAMRQQKGTDKGLGTDSAALMRQVEAELKRLSALLTAPTPGDPDPDELTRIYLRQVARNHR